MATTSYTLTDADAGKVFPVRDGYLTDLTMIQPPSSHGRREWHFTLQDERALSSALRNLVSVDPASNGGFACWAGAVWINASVRYWGALRALSVPRDSRWEIVIDDAPRSELDRVGR